MEYILGWEDAWEEEITATQYSCLESHGRENWPSQIRKIIRLGMTEESQHAGKTNKQQKNIHTKWGLLHERFKKKRIRERNKKNKTQGQEGNN